MALMGYKIEGHAGFAEHGQDIVCAGVSALAQGVLLGLRDAFGDKVSFRKRPGYLAVDLDSQLVGCEASSSVLRVLELGILAMQEAYPNHIDVTYSDID